MTFHFFNPVKNKKAHKKLQAAKSLITIPALYMEKIEKYKRITGRIASQYLSRRDKVSSQAPRFAPPPL